MEIDLSTVPGRAVLHHCRTRDGSRFALIVRADGTRQIVVYHRVGHDAPLQTLTLEPDEADRLAELLHSAPIRDRVAELERRIDELSGERGPA
ncbi:hypothetical protein IU501_19160 [Nocardia otitidiscaviarum]|uniref:Potassium/proton antiporter subunit KhtT-like N-terminal domain-containing protein n=1 Tax=Nocardia otitidiscaviarum TaxID=1823 RepID=A0A378YV65_9NOCA|nr:hypothetical protein [Nocardia otitidiscaviarum]MBF6237089.1 hypothetical protein [Nocardia otitidiscaviarum]MBF6486935.1 hypothetical protein [Nocardia otitidiscaviarum]SUA80309.1 Uncharacterised protein [Nocardia otitidiscaviarum]